MVYNRKAQLAVETLLIYGIAILIVMLAIGALIGFGVLDLSSLLPEQCTIGSTQCDATISSFSDLSTANVHVEFQNNLGANIQITMVNISDNGNYLGMWQCAATNEAAKDPLGNPSGFTGSTSTVANGDKQVINMLCQIKSIKSGKRIEGNIVMQYNKVGSGLSQYMNGKLRKTIN